jgi:hypothetical protein
MFPQESKFLGADFSILLRKVSLALFLLAVACSNSSESAEDPKSPATPDPSKEGSGKDEPGKDVTEVFPTSLLKDYLKWTPVLPNDAAFQSDGHGKIWVRSYLNSEAKTSADRDKPFPMLEGSYLAKAVVSGKDQPSTAATRVYFMKKMPSGFDKISGDWAYAVANLKDGTLAFDASIEPKEELCVTCHAKYLQSDFVKTVEFYRKGSTTVP